MRKRLGDGVIRLQALLDALEADLLAASADELREILRETSRARPSACREVRLLLDEVAAASEEEPIMRVSAGVAGGTGLLRN